MEDSKKTSRGFKRFGRFLFLVIGFLLGWWIVSSIISFIAFFEKEKFLAFVCSGSGAILFASVGFFTADLIMKMLLSVYRKFEKALSRFAPRQIFMGIVGLIAGLSVTLVLHLLIITPYVEAAGLSLIITISIGLVFSFFGTMIGGNVLSKLSILSDIEAPKHATPNSNGSIILDSSSLIDGRILDIVKSGFVWGRLIVPDFIFREVSLIADSDDMLKKNRGRRGLDILNALKDEKNINLDIIDTDFSGTEVDSKIIKLAELCGAPIITVDFNLNKLASIKSLRILNINDLAKAIKPVTLPGERITAKIVKEGKERGQGVAYLEDGTMIVVENGSQYIGSTKEVVITTAYQTSAGRMIFARVDE